MDYPVIVGDGSTAGWYYPPTRARDGARQGTPRGFCSFALPCLAPWVFGRALPCLAPWDSGRALPCPVGFWACPVGALPRAPRGMLPQRAML